MCRKITVGEGTKVKSEHSTTLRTMPLTDKLYSAYFKAVVIAYVSYHSTGLLAGSIAHCSEPLSELLINQLSFAVLLFENTNFKFLKNPL